jgi:hypothetical protein
MDNIFHFNEPTVKSYKKKNLSLVPINLIRALEDDQKNDEEEENNHSPVIHKTYNKSKFATSPPIKPSNSLIANCMGTREEDMSDEEENFINLMTPTSMIIF